MKKIFFSIACFMLAGQLMIAQELDWELTDIDGNTHQFFSELSPARVGILFFGATWSTSSWQAHNTGVLEELFQAYGPDGEDILRVYFLESDQSTTLEDIQGTGSNTKGDWTEGVSYPIFNLVNGQIPSEYNITSMPTITLVDTSKSVAILNLWGSNFNVEYISEIIESYKTTSETGQLAEMSDVQLFPNPASINLTVAFSGSIPDSVKLINSSGQTFPVICERKAGVGFELDISALTPDLYYVVIVSGRSLEIKSFVKL
jgi:hypothetical protein